LNIKSQQKNQYGHLQTLNCYCSTAISHIGWTLPYLHATSDECLKTLSMVCYICPQTTQNSRNCAKQVCSWQRCYHRHDNINLT